MEVNEETIEEHIKKIGMPYTWGTHIEVLAVTTLYGISIYVTRQTPSGSYYWEEIKPLKADGFSNPLVPTELVPDEYKVPNHMELGYMNGVHYDSVVSTITNKVPEHIPLTQQPQVLADITNTIVVNY